MARELTLEEQVLEHKLKSKPLQTEEEKLNAMFALIDKNGDGHIELLELQEGLKKMNLSVSEEKVSQMFLLADKNHDGEISFEEFVKFFRPLPKMVELTNTLPRDLAQKNVSIPVTANIQNNSNNNSFSGTLTQQNRTRSRRSGSATPDSNNSSMSMENSVNPVMTNEETEQALRDLFEAMDTNKSGTIEVSELKDGFRQFGYNISEGRLAQMFSAADKDRNGTIEYEEFCSFFKHLPQLAGMMQNERIKRRSVETHVLDNESNIPRRPFYRRPPPK